MIRGFFTRIITVWTLKLSISPYPLNVHPGVAHNCCLIITLLDLHVCSAIGGRIFNIDHLFPDRQHIIYSGFAVSVIVYV